MYLVIAVGCICLGVGILAGVLAGVGIDKQSRKLTRHSPDFIAMQRGAEKAGYVRGWNDALEDDASVVEAYKTHLVRVMGAPQLITKFEPGKAEVTYKPGDTAAIDLPKRQPGAALDPDDFQDGGCPSDDCQDFHG